MVDLDARVSLSVCVPQVRDPPYLPSDNYTSRASSIRQSRLARDVPQHTDVTVRPKSALSQHNYSTREASFRR